jgi:nucleolar protein 58
VNLLQCIADGKVNELIRGIRAQMTSLIDGLEEQQLKAMQLGLGHTLSRYKLKFSPDKVDTMIVQAIGLLDELDKEVNTYAMRVKEWYGWHFPEMQKIVLENLHYAQVIIKMGTRNHAKETDFSDILPTEVEEQLKESAQVSMGTDISKQDLDSIKALAEQVVGLMEYRRQLSEYLSNRMHAIAPNLTMMVGELVGARLISHAGSLMNLAKQPASTVQILGAEKALFRALKTKHDTPKYGLIYHASLIGQTAAKNKGKISRVLAAKTALSIRVDALGDTTEPTVALEARAKVEARLRQLEGGARSAAASSSKGRSKIDGSAVGSKSEVAVAGASSSSSSKGGYNAGADVQISGVKRKERPTSEDPEEQESEPEAKKAKVSSRSRSW